MDLKKLLRSLSEEEQSTIHWAIDMNSHGWIIDEFNRANEARDYDEYQYNNHHLILNP